MIVFERRKPRVMIAWLAVFMATQFFGYIAYLIVCCVDIKKKNSFLIKEKEDEIYSKLVSKNMYNYDANIDDKLFEFNSMVYDAKTTLNNSCEVINTFAKFKENLTKELNNSEKYIFIELKQIDNKDLEDIKSILISKAKDGLNVRLTLDCKLPSKLVKELKLSGVKVYRFSKYRFIYSNSSNLRSMISIDGNVVYVGDYLSKKAKNEKIKIDYAVSYLKLKGEVCQSIDLTLRHDLAFSSGKYIDFQKNKREECDKQTQVQVVSNNINLDVELLLIKAICTAQKSIQLQVNDFVPTDSIMSLLKYATNSNLNVRLMISLRDYKAGRKFASRAFAKELALLGANVYLFDGYINYNSIVLDDKYVITGSYSLNRNSVSSSLQTIILFRDEKIVDQYNKAFDNGVKNSYRVNNAKYMLIREKIFKKLY